MTTETTDQDLMPWLERSASHCVEPYAEKYQAILRRLRAAEDLAASLDNCVLSIDAERALKAWRKHVET